MLSNIQFSSSLLVEEPSYTKHVSFSEELAPSDDGATSDAGADGEIDESKIDRLLHILHEVDPTRDTSDSKELTYLEGNK